MLQVLTKFLYFYGLRCSRRSKKNPTMKHTNNHYLEIVFIQYDERNCWVSYERQKETSERTECIKKRFEELKNSSRPTVSEQ